MQIHLDTNADVALNYEFAKFLGGCDAYNFIIGQ